MFSKELVRSQRIFYLRKLLSSVEKLYIHLNIRQNLKGQCYQNKGFCAEQCDNVARPKNCRVVANCQNNVSLSLSRRNNVANSRQQAELTHSLTVPLCTLQTVYCTQAASAFGHNVNCILRPHRPHKSSDLYGKKVYSI